MKELIVITPCTVIAGNLPRLTEQLAAAGVEHHIETLPPPPPLGWNLGTKVEFYKSLAVRFADYSYIVITDAFDVNFFGSSVEEIISRIPETHVLCAAEKNCYPDPSVGPSIIALHPDRVPHSFFNGGLTAATPANLMEWMLTAERHPKFIPAAIDQWFFNEWLAEGGDRTFEIDHSTSMFYCLYLGYDELDFVDGEPVNRTFDTWPLWIHSNGGWSSEEMWRKYEASK